jgi:SAM-dependent methyltransferase
VHEILSSLKQGEIVLDLGSGSGSFDPGVTAARVVRVDREVRAVTGASLGVHGDAAHLPFAEATFSAVIANHSFEHFDDLPAVLREVGRVIKPEGALFVSVPDASTLCDRLYRWLADGGGHVNPFTSAPELATVIEKATGLRHVATRTLYSSLSYLNRRNAPSRLPRRLWLLGGGYEWSLFLFAWASRWVDRVAHRRWSVYGWALYFGAVPEPVDTAAWINVCLRCGAGAPSAQLMRDRMFPPSLFLPARYRCPACGACNTFANDEASASYNCS